MTMSDPIADMLTRIRNGQHAKKNVVRMPASKVKKAIAEVLEKEGYILGVTEAKDEKGFAVLDVELKYYAGQPVINEIKRLSTPGLRQYTSSTDIPTMRDGLGITIVTTSHGVMTDMDAREKKLGGELLCQVF
ncbi:MAG: 30S ribosomal protein S8 [Magnetococcales bacterium]|nr:30S ribosomal protein S8 [Magnetococcales bacterium]